MIRRRPLIFGSVCSGIEAASVAWKPLGWRCAFVSEVAKFPRAVLRHRHPEVPLHGDFTTIRPGYYAPIDLLVGGTPCQSFSIAGLRGGMDDDRGNLALEFLRLAQRLRPRWLVWENVPGVLSSNGGRDFGSILGGLVELGYGFAYRVLDAQFFGVAQRRRRVFVVGYLGDWTRAAAVLSERSSLLGNPAPSRQAGKGVAALTANGVGTCGADDNQGQAGHLIPAPGPGGVAGTLNANGKAAGSATQQDAESGMLVEAFGGNNTRGAIDVATAVNAHGGPHGRLDFESETFVTHSLRGEGFDASEDGSGRGTPLVPMCFSSKDFGGDVESDLSPTLRAGGHTSSHANAGVPPAIAYPINADALRGEGSAKTPSPDAEGRVRLRDPGLGIGAAGDPAGTISAAGPGAVAFALRGREGGSMPEVGGDIVGSLRAADGGSSRDYVAYRTAGDGGVYENGDHTAPLTTQTDSSTQLVAFSITPSNSNKDYNAREVEKAQALTAAGNRPSARGGDLVTAGAVRRLTPRECERLQGFPDDYTLIPEWAKGLAKHDQEETARWLLANDAAFLFGDAETSAARWADALRMASHPDGPRYKALGNSMAVPVMRWIGERIAEVEALYPVAVSA